MAARGATENEAIEAIQNSEWTHTKKDRMDCRKDFEYNKKWNNKFYATKQVRPVFKELENEILVITVYTYYF